MSSRLAVRAGVALLAVLLFPARAPAPETPPAVLVIEGTYLGPDGEGLAAAAHEAAVAVGQALALLGLPYRATTDAEVAQGRVDPRAFALILLPYNRALSPAEVNLLTQALDQGARVVAFHRTAAPLATRLGVQGGEFVKAASAPPRGLRGEATVLPGVPEQQVLHPRFLRPFTVSGAGTQVAARWEPSTAEAPGEPAVALNEAGAFLGFIPTKQDAPSLAALLWALVARLAPAAAQARPSALLLELGPVGPYGSLEEMLEAWRLQREEVPPAARESAASARAEVTRAREALGQGQVTEAIQAMTQARRLAGEAHWRSLPTAAPEFRAVWGYPWAWPDWEGACARLEAAHFNLLFPYVASGGIAYYPSALLPHGERDYLAEAVAAAGRHGLELHPRVLGLACLFASEATKKQLAAAGRLSLNAEGKPSDWLCPTDPRNRAQLVGVCAEIVTRYPVAGVQLDYFRFDTLDTCTCARCRAAFQRDTGQAVGRWPQEILKGGGRQEQFLTWRRGVLTGLLRELRLRLREVRPGAKLSVAVFPNWETHPRSVGQDPVAWAREGLVDLLCPMNYTRDLGTFSARVSYQLQVLEGKVPLAPGIGAFADGMNFAGPQELADQILAARKLGAPGFVVFNWNERFATEFLPQVALGLTSAPAGSPWSGQPL